MAKALYEQVESSVLKKENKVGRSMYDESDFSDASPVNSSNGPKARASAARLEREIAGAFAQTRFDRVAALAGRYIEALISDDGTAV